MDTLEVRRIVADTLGLAPADIGAIRGDNMLLITVADAHKPLMSVHNQDRILTDIARSFGPAHVHLGYIRFI